LSADRRVFPVRAVRASTARRSPASSGRRSTGVIRHAGDPGMAEQLAWLGVDRFENGDPRWLRRRRLEGPASKEGAFVAEIHSGGTHVGICAGALERPRREERLTGGHFEGDGTLVGRTAVARSRELAALVHGLQTLNIVRLDTTVA
jgi:hypothetical protein